MTKYIFISENIIEFAKCQGRFHLPWKQDINGYRVWVSEIMLQQTQVQTVIDYFQRFMLRFPDMTTLARAPIEDILSVWSGLGYYRRAHLMHACAQVVVKNHNGELPTSLEDLMALPGIGRTTAGAILAQAHDIPAPILDGNVKRVLMRCFEIDGYMDDPKVQKKLWALSTAITPEKNVAWYTQGIMDLGANICTKSNPSCEQCPISTVCASFKSESVHLRPQAKPKKLKPTKRCFFALVYNPRQEILLLQRPTKGIWGGLWCLPALAPNDRFELHPSHSLHQHATTQHIGSKQKHVFTHFNLEYKPVIMQQRHHVKFKQRKHLWVEPRQALEMGLPVPIRKILKETTWPR